MNNFHDLAGERKNQVLITCDKYGRINGYATRQECHQGKGFTHLAFMAFIYDSGNRVILAKRSRNKSLWATFWDASVVSHVLPGETSEVAAKRRGKEELGIEVDFHKIGDFYYFAPHGNDCENEFCHVLIGQTNTQVLPNPLEISEIKKMKMRELREDIKINTGKYTPWLVKSLTRRNVGKWIHINNWIKNLENEHEN